MAADTVPERSRDDCKLPPIFSAFTHEQSKFPYSQHDNQHTTEIYGEHMDQKLGRRHMLKNNQHHTGDIITWQAPVPKTTSVYRYSFTDAVRTHKTSKSCPDLCFHRYTKNYAIEKRRLMHTTTSKQPEVTPLSTLAITQVPRSNQEPWKYAYKHHKI